MNRNSLRTIERAITEALRDRTANTLEIGRLLIEAKAKVRHGLWLHWLEGRFPLSTRTAENYMAAAEFVAEKQIKIATVANLPLGVLYDMANDHYAEDIVDEILALAEREIVTAEKAANIAADAVGRRLSAAGADAIAAEDDEADEADPYEEAEAILDGEPPALPSPGEAEMRFATTTPDIDVADFCDAVEDLRRLSTRLRAADAAAGVSPEMLRAAADFLAAVVAVSAPEAERRHLAELCQAE